MCKHVSFSERLACVIGEAVTPCIDFSSEQTPTADPATGSAGCINLFYVQIHTSARVMFMCWILQLEVEVQPPL